MKLIKCSQCGAGEMICENGYMICRYCNAKYIIEKDDIGARQSTISLESDIEGLLNKCRMEPQNAKKYANLILDIDPGNKEAKRYL